MQAYESKLWKVSRTKNSHESLVSPNRGFKINFQDISIITVDVCNVYCHLLQEKFVSCIIEQYHMNLKIFYLVEQVLNHVLGKLLTYFSILKKSLKNSVASKQQAWSLWEVVKCIFLSVTVHSILLVSIPQVCRGPQREESQALTTRPNHTGLLLSVVISSKHFIDGKRHYESLPLGKLECADH